MQAGVTTGYTHGRLHNDNVKAVQMPSTRRSLRAVTTLCAIQYSSQPGQVTVTNPVPYAAIHNNGGTINTHPSVTKRMRRFAWAKVYALAGVKGKLPKQLPAAAAKWRALALTKKSKLNITARIPQRQFMGDSHELKQKINTIINDSIKRIENGILNI